MPKTLNVIILLHLENITPNIVQHVSLLSYRIIPISQRMRPLYNVYTVKC